MNTAHLKARKALPLLIIALLFLLPACAGKKTPKPGGHAKVVAQIEDLRQFPQNLQVFANAYGANRLLLDRESQDALNARFNSVYFGPWQMKRTTIPRSDVAALFKRARGFKNAEDVWSQGEWDAMAANANLSAYPSRARAAITLRNTDLRELPTHARRFTEPTPDIKLNPFDYFQYSLLAAGMPLLVAHTTLDGRWHYVECPIAGGWVDAGDVAFVDGEFQRLWQNGSFAALVRDNVSLPGTGPGGGDGKAGIGAILPLARENAMELSVLVPVKGRDGMADSAEIRISARDAVKKPMTLTAGNVAKIGDAMMGQPYGWGGTLGDRDCSAMLRDLFTPFGLWLPRNSRAQARRGEIMSLEGMDMAEKEAFILANGRPFISLVGMRGHIALYVGKWKGRAAIFHNVWGVRIVEDGDDDGRLVIGKAVVTSITPGMELKNLYRPVTFVDRLRTLTRLGSR